MTKTGRIITATLLTIATIGLVVFAVKKGTKPKTLQTNAEDTQITDLTNTAWTFNETLSYSSPTGYQMNSLTLHTESYNIKASTEQFNTTQLIFTINQQTNRFYTKNNTNTFSYSYLWTGSTTFTKWYTSKIPTIYITGGTDTTNIRLIQWLQNNATRKTTLENTYNNIYTAGETAGYTAGETAGYESGYTAGETAGYTAGETAGYESGYTAGETAGYTTGYNAGQQNGYAEGYNDSESFNHPIALQPLMLNILTMPFTFISQAFDVTLWPNTQYEFNIANFIKGLIAIATILFIIKMFTSGFSIIGNFTDNTNREIKMRSDNRKSKLAWKSQRIVEKGAKQANKE